MKLKYIMCYFICPLFYLVSHAQPPKLTVIIVIDQLSYIFYMQKLSPNFRGGLKYLSDHGITYSNAYFPHGKPATATGHAGLGCGNYPNVHGLISNGWINYQGISIKCDDDTKERAAVFSPDGEYAFGKSSQHVMVDGISDQFMLHQQPNHRHWVYSLSGKSRSAILTASNLGKPIWFDNQTGLFTSSKAYFDKLPDWVVAFNKEKQIDTLKQVYWTKAYPRSKRAYRFHHTDNYKYSRFNFSLMNRSLPIDITTDPKGETPYHFFEKTPHASQLLFDLAQRCIDEHISRKTKDRMLLWLCLSSPDKLGHLYGPEALESIDMIYHIDKQLKRFIKHVHKRVGKKDILFVVTADHGVSLMPERLRDAGMLNARRIDEKTFINRINQYIENKHGMPNIVYGYKSPNLYLNTPLLQTKSLDDQQNILTDIKTFLELEPGIKQAWITKELLTMPVELHSFADHFKKQIFPGRSGHIIIQVHPNNLITKWPKGASHQTPYECDTHVPLMIYQSGRFEQRCIREKVWALQLPNTLADILEVPKPSASTFEVLPGLFEWEEKL